MTAAISTAHSDAAGRPKRRKRRVPSERNRLVFVEVVIRGREQPEVARKLGITQQRVSQIIEQFYGWLAENVPPGAGEMSAEEQLRLAANLTFLRQEHAYNEARRNLQESSQETHYVKIRCSAKGEELWRETIQYTHAPKCSYLNAAVRACTQKWAVVRMAQGLMSRGMGVEEDLREGKRQAGMPAPARKAGETPAPRGARKVLCENEPPRPSRPLLASAPAAATSVATPACVLSPRRKLAGADVHTNFFKPCADAHPGDVSE